MSTRVTARLQASFLPMLGVIFKALLCTETISLQNSLDRALRLLNLDSEEQDMLLSYMIRQEESISRFSFMLRTGRGKAGVWFLEPQTKWPFFSLEPYLSSKSDWQTSEWVCGGQCLKNENKTKNKLSLQGSQLTYGQQILLPPPTPHSVGSLSTPLIVSFAVQKPLISCNPPCQCFGLCTVLRVISRTAFCLRLHPEVFSVISPGSFIVSTSVLKSLIHFKLIFLYFY